MCNKPFSAVAFQCSVASLYISVVQLQCSVGFECFQLAVVIPFSVVPSQFSTGHFNFNSVFSCAISIFSCCISVLRSFPFSVVPCQLVISVLVQFWVVQFLFSVAAFRYSVVKISVSG